MKPISNWLPAWGSFRFNRRLQQVFQKQTMMGTFVSVTALHPSRDQAEEAVARAFAEMDRVSSLLTRYDTISAVGTLNRDGYLADPPPELHTVLQRSAYFHHLSGGAFDITVAPLLELFQENFERFGSVPPEGAIAETATRVDGKAVCLDDRRIRFGKDGMAVTLDGIAKGYTVDCGIRVLEQHGIENAIINAGGEIRAIGKRDGRSPWRVAVQDPAKEDGCRGYLHVSQGAVATSGNYEVYFDEEKIHHHTLNPRTGQSPREVSSVTVTAATVMDADALATAVYVMGPSAGLRLIETLPGVECLLLLGNDQRASSSGWVEA